MITNLPAPCWHMPPYFNCSDHDPHFDTEEEAVKDRLESFDENAPAPVPLPSPCIVLICDGCKAKITDDEIGTIHFPDEAEARSLASVYDFVVLADGTAICFDCKLLPHAHVGANTEWCDRCNYPSDEHDYETAGAAR